MTTSARGPNQQGAGAATSARRPNRQGTGAAAADGARPQGPGAEAWALMVRLFLWNRPRLAAIAHEFDLAPMQLHALRALEPGKELPMSALAESLACDASNVTGIVDRLEARGLIERRGAAHDRRVKMLVVTNEGARVRERLVRRMAEPPPAIAALSRRDQRALRDLLGKALDA